MNQQAIDIAENMLSKYTDNISWDNFQYDSWYCNALEHILEDLKSLWDGWIPVTERLPEEHSDILVYYYWNRNSKFFPECQYMKQTSYYNDRFECEEEVTHWMNLPDSPK